MAEEKLTKQPLPVPTQLGSLAVEATHQILDPIGERIPLANGRTLERLNPALLAELQANDPRVRYIPIDSEAAQQRSTPQVAFSHAVLGRMGKQVHADFPGIDVSVRGTVAALIEKFPFWNVEGHPDMSSDMHTVTDILQLGSDNGSDRVRVGGLEDGELNSDTAEWMYNHISTVILEADRQQDSDQTFPVLLVYEPSAFAASPGHGWNRLTGQPDQRLAALYITDKLV
jgi:hypothetical protein